MKLTTFILIASLVQVSAASFGQRITLSQNKATLRQVFAEIKKQTGYDVFYQAGKVKEDKVINANFSNAPLEKVMEQCLEGQSLTFTIDEKTVLINEKEPSFLDNLVARFAAIDVRGVVVDKAGLPLVGATVAVKGTNKMAKTDGKGAFYLADVDENKTLQISYTGFKTLEIEAKENLGNITLEESDNPLDEVQVIAYGTTTRRLSTGNISSVKMDEIEIQPINNPLLALQGRAPGIFIEQANGFPGSDLKIRVQGQNSLQNGNEPFYVIDGVPYPLRMLTSLASTLGSQGGSPFSFISPSQIESIEVLKDADATAIYGSRAANGAILITTKKGIAGKTRVDIHTQTGFGNVPRFLDLVNTEEYLKMRLEAKRNDNAAIASSDYDINGVWDQSRNTDWQRTLLGGTARITNLQGSVSGGSRNTQFLVGAGYYHENTIFTDKLSDRKASLNFNISHISDNKKFQLGLLGNYLNGLNNLPQTDITGTVIRQVPNAPKLYNDDGNLNFQLLSGTATFNNPIRQFLLRYENLTTNLISNGSLSYELLSGLKIKSSFGFNSLRSDEQTIVPLTAFPPGQASNARSASYSDKVINSWIIEPQIEYHADLRIGVLELLLGSSFQASDNHLLSLRGSGYNTDAELDNILSASNVSLINTIESKYRYSGIFARLNYRFQNKYLINLNARRDGSSRFGSENLFNTFYSIGGGYILSEEAVIRDKFSFLSFGKIKVSYGTTGNDQIGDYNFLSLYSPVSGITSPYQGATGTGPNGHSNPYLQWEVTHKLNIGLDAGFLKDKILFNINYYTNRSSNQLLSYTLPILTGFATILRNQPAIVKNSGWEMNVNFQSISKKHFSWNSGINLTIATNKLVSYPNLNANASAAANYIIGKPISITRLFKYAGVNPQIGVYQFETRTGDITSNPNSTLDRTEYVRTIPDYYGGWSNQLSFRGFTLDFLIQFVKQKKGNSFIRFGERPGTMQNQPITAIDRWRQAGDVAYRQRTNSNSSLLLASTFASLSNEAYTDASFVRLKNASVSYELPQNLLSKVKLAKLRLFVQGQNLVTITRFKGFDPENASFSSLPPLRVITTGINLSL